MLIEFKGERSAEVVMFGSVATELLKMMGQSGNTEGAIRAEDVPQALKKLEESLGNLPDVTQDDEDGQPQVTLHTRAKPIIDLLNSCISDNSYMMWKPQ